MTELNEDWLQKKAHEVEKQDGIIGHIIRKNYKNFYRQKFWNNKYDRRNPLDEELINKIFDRIKSKGKIVSKYSIKKVLREVTKIIMENEKI